MRIYHVGQSIKSVFPAETTLVGRHLEDIFRLIRPDILLEWNRVSLSEIKMINSFIVLCLATFLWKTYSFRH